jgi:hypothetical protein
MTRAFWGKPQFPGQEEIPCWSVCQVDGIGQDDSYDDFKAALKDPEVKYRLAENLTLAEAAILVAEVAEYDPELYCFVLPVSPSWKPT